MILFRRLFMHKNSDITGYTCTVDASAPNSRHASSRFTSKQRGRPDLASIRQHAWMLGGTIGGEDPNVNPKHRIYQTKKKLENFIAMKGRDLGGPLFNPISFILHKPQAGPQSKRERGFTLTPAASVGQPTGGGLLI